MLLSPKKILKFLSIALTALALIGIGCGNNEKHQQSKEVPLANTKATKEAEIKSSEQQAVGLEKRLLLVSIDGLSPKSLMAANSVTIKKLIANGHSSMNAKTTKIPITLPSHASMLSGVSPDVHQLTWNDYFENKPDIAVPTIFDHLKEKNLKTAMVVGKEKLKHIGRIRNGKDSNSIDKYFLLQDPEKIVTTVLDLFLNEKINFIFLHLAYVDAAGHHFGWHSTEQLRAVEVCDLLLEKLLRHLREENMLNNFAIIISSDHGGQGKSHEQLSEDTQTIPWIAWSPFLTYRDLSLTNQVSTYDNMPTISNYFEIPLSKSDSLLGKKILLK